MRVRTGIFVGLVSLILSGCGGEAVPRTTGAAPDAPAMPSTVPPGPGTNPPGQSADVVRVVDGDSLEVAIDGTPYEVRLIGVNAPERDECHGDESRTQLQELVDAREVTLEATGDDIDQYGRLLRYVWADGVDINARMLATGAAVALHSGHARQEDYVRTAREATQRQRGMWAIDVCGPAEQRTLVIAPIEYDPAGRDEENAISEWIEIVNAGSESVDLTGWTLRDESSTHRYMFGPVILEPGGTVRVRSGCGEDRGLDLVWCASDTVWNNRGDTAILQDTSGNVVAVRTYDDGFPTARFLDD